MWKHIITQSSSPCVHNERRCCIIVHIWELLSCKAVNVVSCEAVPPSAWARWYRLTFKWNSSSLKLSFVSQPSFLFLSASAVISIQFSFTRSNTLFASPVVRMILASVRQLLHLPVSDSFFCKHPPDPCLFSYTSCALDV